MKRLPWPGLLLLFAFAAVSGACLSSDTVARADGRRLEVIGVLKSRDGSPAVGEVVYVAAVAGSRISTNFRLEGGRTTGLANPHAETGADGRFRIVVEPAFFSGQGSEFTIGVLDCPRCFTFPRRRLVRGGVPLTFRLAPGSASTGRLDLGEIALE